MNRRSFFKALAATAIVATASTTKLGRTVLEIVEDRVEIGRRYADALARSLIHTRGVLAGNVFNTAFTQGDVILEARADLTRRGVWHVKGAQVDLREPWV